MPLQDAVHLEIGRSTEFAFVFSCPGRCESEARPPGPAKGATGTNLDELVQQLDPNRQLPLLHRGQARIRSSTFAPGVLALGAPSRTFTKFSSMEI